MDQDRLLKAILGEEIFEGLAKALEKLNTKSVVDIQELRAALKVVPKAVMAFLIRELKPMEIHEAKEIKLPYHDNALLLVNKDDQDVYHGQISQDGKVVHDFELVSIPQLAAHLVSNYELYEEAEGQEYDPELTRDGEVSDLKHDLLSEKIKTLEAKVDQVMVMLSQLKPQSKIEKSETKDLHEKVRKILSSRSLSKAGIMPTMPKPPRPGVHSGSQQGISKEGFHGPKTEHSDLNTHPVTSTRNPFLKQPKPQPGQAKQPKQPKQPKSAFTTAKSESSKCADCGEMLMKSGEYIGCSCFRALSKPSLIKSESAMTFSFMDDWDSESRYALWITLNKKG